jgi:hypothetical protein
MIGPGQNLHQGGFSRPIFAQQGYDFTGVYLKVYVAKRLHAWETLGNPDYPQYRFFFQK